MAERELYEKPTIIRHTVGLQNKFGRPSGTMPLGRIDGVEIKSLIAKFGSPLYVLSEYTLRRKYREMIRAFELRYPKVRVSWSYKTNYLSGVCAILHAEGAWAEVVSGFEYEQAKQLGIPGEKIIFNGPYKTREELERAVADGAMVNVDCFEEIYLLEDIAKRLGRPIEVGMRVNFELNYPPWDRFGFHFESAQAFEAAKRIHSQGFLKLVGLHCHAGTYIDSTETYRLMAEKLVFLAGILKRDLNIDLKYWDTGGGYASINTLHTSWVPGEQSCPTFDQYAEAICPTLLGGPFEASNAPLLLLEPGRALIDEAMSLITSVVAVKRLANGTRGVVVDAGVNLLSSSYWYRYDVVPVEDKGVLTEESMLLGPLCMQIDVLRQSIVLPPLRRGDLLLVKNVGAYNFSQSVQFIRMRPAVVGVWDGEPYLLREAEGFDDVKRLEKVPERLAK